MKQDRRSFIRTAGGAGLLALAAPGLAAADLPTVDVTDLGARPDSGENCIEVLRRAAARCNELKRARLYFPPGDYLVRDPRAVADFDLLMQGKLDPEIGWTAPYDSFNLALVFRDCEDLIIDGPGARLIFAGLVQPFGFHHCRRVRMAGLAVDWERPAFSTGHVIARSAMTMEIDFGPFPLQGGEPAFTFIPFDPATGAFGSFEAYDPNLRLQAVRPGVMSLTHPFAAWFKPGDGIVARHVGHYRPAVHAYGCDDVTVEDVTLNAAPGMGLLGHRCGDVTVRGLKVAPAGERVMSINADATHFISCTGTVTLDHCSFQGMGDDGTNVHSFYLTVNKRQDRQTLVCTVPHVTQDRLLDYPDPGDRIEFVRRATLKPYAEGEVTECAPDQDRWEMTVRLASPLPSSFIGSDLIQNVSQLPRLRMAHTTVRLSRARAALVQTRDAVIDNCSFERTTGTGVHVNTARGWWESAATRDVTIRNNRIIGCGYGPGTYENASAVCVGTEALLPARGVHRDLTIEDNVIESTGNPAVLISRADGVTLRGNRISGTDTPVKVRCCRNVTLG